MARKHADVRFRLGVAEVWVMRGCGGATVRPSARPEAGVSSEASRADQVRGPDVQASN